MPYKTPSSISEFTGRFENSDFAQGNVQRLFYYELSTKTINFGYGINLTAAAKDPHTRQIVDAALKAQGITFTDSQWSSIGSVSSKTPRTNNGCACLNSKYPLREHRSGSIGPTSQLKHRVALSRADASSGARRRYRAFL